MELASIMSADPVRVAPDASVNEALTLMDDQDVRHLPVIEDGRLVGVVSDRDVISEIGWLPARSPTQRKSRGEVRTVRDIMHSPPTTAAPDDTLVTAAVDLVVEGIGCLPIVDGDDVVGMVSEMDLASAFWRLAQDGKLEDVDPRVHTLMAKQPITAKFNTTIEDAIAKCKDHHVRHLPVVSGGRLMGVVSDRDLRAATAQGKHLEQPVGTIMACYPVTLKADDRVSDAAERMVGHRISCLPVVEGANLKGIVTLTDLLDHCLSTLRDPEPDGGSPTARTPTA
jgi:CBS domain-containing protein